MRTIPAVSILFLLVAGPLLAQQSYPGKPGTITDVRQVDPSTLLRTTTSVFTPALRPPQEGRQIRLAPTPAGAAAGIFYTPLPLQLVDGLQDDGAHTPAFRFAVGEEEIVIVQGDRFRIMNKCGDVQVDMTFLELFGDTLFFPEADVVYDQWADRMVLMAAGVKNNPVGSVVHLATWEEPFVTTPSITLASTRIDWEGSTPRTYWCRDLRLGLDGEFIYVVSHQWSIGTPSVFFDSKLRALYKPAVYAASGILYDDFLDLRNPYDNSVAQYITPAKMHSWAGAGWLLNSAPGGDTYLTQWALTGPPSGPNLYSYNVPLTTPYAPVEDAYQPDSTRIQLGDCRLWNAAFHADTLWTAMVEAHEMPPGHDTSAIRTIQIKASTQTEVHSTGISTDYIGYPQIDVDGQGRGYLTMMYVDNLLGEYPSSVYMTVPSMGGFPGVLELFAPGTGNYDDGGAQPWDWGPAHGVARDPVDNTTMWIGGAYSIGATPPRWGSTLAMTAMEPPGVMAVTQLGNGVIDNYIDGFIHPDSVEYYVTNNGGSMVYWSFSGADTLVESTWEGVTAEPLAPGETDTVVVYLGPGAFGLPQGFYNDTVTFTDCVSGSTEMRTVEVVWAEDYECGGAWASVMWADSLSFGTASHQKRGAFVTATKDIELCAVTPKLWISGPQVVTVTIYEADGNQRGALIASQPWVVIPWTSEHIIPMHVVLERCRDYNITFEWGEANQWLYADMAVNPFPLDLLGAFRVRSGEANGIADPVVPQFELTFSSLAVPVVADPAPPGITWNTVPVFQSGARMEIIPMQTLNLSGVSMRGAFPSLPGTLIADASDTGGMYVTGSGWRIIDTPGLQDHLIPVSEVLYEGRVYAVSTYWGGMFDWQAAPPGGFPAMWPVDDWFKVNLWYVPTPGESNVKHMKLHFAPFDTGTPLHLGKPDELPPHEVTGGSMLHGAYITSNADLNAWAVDWFADVPPGSTITARVYQATGNTRGALLTEGSIQSGRDGMNWHLVPISAELASGGDYDVEIVADGSNLWRWWSDESGMPIVRNGVITIRDGERNGDAGIVGLLEMRLWACNTTATGIENPVRAPQFFVSAPYPNPTGRRSVIDYSLDRAGTVEITLYDVAGRRVATVLESAWQPAGPGKVVLDTVRLPVGVYFVKMRMPAQSVSRKITVLR